MYDVADRDIGAYEVDDCRCGKGCRDPCCPLSRVSFLSKDVDTENKN